MPKFSQQEKINIRQKLMEKGALLFCAQGIKKVTIDELAWAANIAKATFYTFYKSKEYLYLDIVQSAQKAVFDETETVLEKNQAHKPKDRAIEVFGEMQAALSRYPILAQIDTATVELIARKVSPERMQEFAQSNYDAAHAMTAHGIAFSCETEVASETFQAIYHAWLYLHGKPAKTQKAVTDILLEGALDKLLA